MIKKTYAAKGLLDWQMALNVGGAIIRIHFSGGHMGSAGVVPARYSTTNEALQKIIEKTSEYKSGKIYLLSRQSLDDRFPDSCSLDKREPKNTNNHAGNKH